MEHLRADNRWLPPENELEEKFILTGGPGGQHVNRTETGVQLRFNVSESSFLKPSIKARLLDLAGRRADSSGVIMIESRSSRSQYRNREQARIRLAELIEKAAKPPRKRLKTRPTRAAKKKRLRAKRHRSSLKQTRGKPGPDD